MDYSKLNKVLANLDAYDLKRKFTVVASHRDDDCGEELDQGDTSEEWFVLDIGEEYFLKVINSYDSYGSEAGITGLQFVKGVEKTVTVYEFPG